MATGNSHTIPSSTLAALWSGRKQARRSEKLNVLMTCMLVDTFHAMHQLSDGGDSAKLRGMAIRNSHTIPSSKLGALWSRQQQARHSGMMNRVLVDTFHVMITDGGDSAGLCGMATGNYHTIPSSTLGALWSGQ